MDFAAKAEAAQEAEPIGQGPENKRADRFTGGVSDHFWIVLERVSKMEVASHQPCYRG
jgi:hypothetical protein